MGILLPWISTLATDAITNKLHQQTIFGGKRIKAWFVLNLK